MGKELTTQDYAKHKALFYRAFERLFSAKGRKVDNTILDGYWSVLGNYPIDLLTKAIDNVSREAGAFMPDAGNIIDEMKRIRDADHSTIVPSYCPDCNNTGLIIITKMYNGTSYDSACRCDCPNGGRVDQRIRPIDRRNLIQVGEKKKLPIVDLIELAGFPADHVWEEGVEISKVCSACGRGYTVRHERRVCAAELQNTHIFNRSTTPQCEDCFIEEGRKRGMWT
jgi:hypothetical protein